MKKILFLSLILFAFRAEAQKGIVFKMKYLPNHDYNGVLSLHINAKVNLSGDDTTLSKLQAQGIKQPITGDVSIKGAGDIKTGPRGAGHVFPLTMTYKIDQLNVNFNGKDMAIPIPATANNMMIYGHVGDDGNLMTDSLTGGKMKDTAQQRITQMMNMVQHNIKFPDRPLHIGDSFTQDMPLGVPMGGKGMNMDSKVVYKLVSIADGKARFDIAQTMNMAIPVKGQTLNLTGSGMGKMVYDIKNSFPTEFKSNMTIKFDGNIEKLGIDATLLFDMDFNYNIN